MIYLGTYSAAIVTPFSHIFVTKNMPFYGEHPIYEVSVTDRH